MVKFNLKKIVLQSLIALAPCGCIILSSCDKDSAPVIEYPDNNGGNSNNDNNNDNNNNSGDNNNGNNDNNSGNSSSNVLAGTRWGGNNDDFYMELYFGNNGYFTETAYGESDSYRYEVNGDVIIFEEGSILNNTFGDSANFEINSSKSTLKIYNSYETYSFTRKL